MRETIQRIQWPFLLLLIMWLIQFVNFSQQQALNRFGIMPRDTSALSGVLFSPWLHGSFQHLVMNSAPFLLLSLLICLKSVRVYVTTTLFIMLAAGLAVWLLARPGFHVGASGLIFGYFGFLLADAFVQKTLKSFLLAVITLLLYGGFFLALWPAHQQISWEAHLFGFLAGLACAFLAKPRRAG